MSDKHSEWKETSNFRCKLVTFFSFTFELLVKKLKTLDEKHSTSLSKLHSTCPKEQFPENSFLWKPFRVQVFVCWWKLFPSFGRRFRKIFEIFILRVQRKKWRIFFLRWSFYLTFSSLSNFSAFWQKPFVGVVKGAWCFIRNNNLWDISFFKSFLFCSRFQNMREKTSDFGNFVRKDFHNCFLRVQRKNRPTYVFWEKIRITSRNNSTFYWKIFQSFVKKTTLYLSSGQNLRKNVFLNEKQVYHFQ